jgi:hypothetical protein
MESTVLGTLINEWPGDLPPAIQTLLRNAPDSFYEPSLKPVAVAIRELDLDGRAVNKHSVLKALGLHEHFNWDENISSLVGDGIPLEPAEGLAVKLVSEWQHRRRVDAVENAAEQLENDPSKSAIIARNVIETLADLDSQGAAKPAFSVRSPDEILGMEFDDTDRILGDRLLATGQSLVIAGAAGIGKSRLLFQLAACCITGRPFLGFDTEGGIGRRWLILQAENSTRRLNQDLGRLRQWLGDDWPQFNAAFRVHTLETDADSMLNLDDSQASANLARAIKDFDPAVVAWDSLYNFGIGDLSKDSDMRVTLDHLGLLSRKGNPHRAIVVLHHALTGRAGMAKATGFDRGSFGRNSKVLLAWCRAQMNVSPGTADSNESLVVSCGKCSNGPEFPTLAAKLTPAMMYEPDPAFDLQAWKSDAAGKSEGAHISGETIKELCADGPTKMRLAKLLQEETGCVRGSAYKAIERFEGRRVIHYSKITKTYAPSLKR